MGLMMPIAPYVFSRKIGGVISPIAVQGGAGLREFPPCEAGEG